MRQSLPDGDGFVRQPARLGFIAFFLAVAAITAAAPARAAPGTVATVNATVVKPLTLKWVQDLDLGTIVLGPGTWTGATVAINKAGVFSCVNANVTCSGATKVAKYTVTGTNNQVVRITAPNVTLVNQNDTTKSLVLVVDSPGTVTMPNSGNQGVTFSLGGSISLSSSTAGGVYAGTFNVTADY
jgi:hypothetical protein